MPVLKNLPSRLKGGRFSVDLSTTHSEFILRKMSLNLNPFEEPGSDEDWPRSNGGSLLDGRVPRDRNPFEDEEDENEANEVRRGGSGKGGSIKGTLERMKGVSPLKTLGKLGKNLRMSSRSKEKDTHSPQGSIGSASPMQRKKKGRRSSEGSLLRMAGKCKESLTNGDLCSETDADSTSRRLSFLKMVGKGKMKRESMQDHSSQGPEEEPVEEVPEVKPREPLSVLEILQLVTKRDLFLADTHILELEQECREAESPTAGGTEDFSSPSSKDSSRRKAKDVELLYEALQKELWDVVKESLRSPTAGPNLGLVVQVLQQEEQADRDWAQSEGAAPGGPRPREFKKRWREAVVELADANLPQHEEARAGELAAYLDKLRVRMVEDLGAARRNVASVYPAEYDSFQVYTQSYHQAVTRRLQAITNGDLQITDIYSLLDWLYNIYNRDVLGTVTITTPINLSQLGPLLPAETVQKLELDCLNSVRRLQEDLERSAAVNRDLGSRVAQCSLNGLADFLYSFQRKVEMFHEMLVNSCELNEDGYIAKTIALVNCCPTFRSFVERCGQCDPSTSEDSIRRANTALDRIVSLSVRVLNDRLFEHIRPLFDKLIKRKWLSNTEPFEQIEVLIKEHFKKFRRMDNPPYEESSASWLDSAIPHLSEIIVLEDTPSIQMEVGVLVREFPDIRRKHVSAILNIRGMTRQTERQEILNIVKDIENSDSVMRVSRDRALFAEVPVTSEVHCLNVGLSRVALTASSLFSSMRFRRRRTPARENQDDML
ncbi:hypothetical protein cypCar_00040644 [Cyprinus carpio]|nr:hypothetical protein cypCar_00040644 [Cyprinus carpio]